jgi:hypothetical protein
VKTWFLPRLELPARPSWSTSGVGVGVGVAAARTVKRTANVEPFPAASSKDPLRLCSPAGSVPVANVTCVPAISGVVSAPSTVAPRTAATGSVAVITTEVAASTVEPLAGVAETSVGAVLSTRMFSRVCEASTAPTASTACARRS